MTHARAYVVLAALLFSTGGAAIKLSVFSSWQIAGLRSGIAAVLLAAVMPSWRQPDWHALLVGVSFAATMILFVTANTLTTASNAIFLQTTAPIYVLVLAPLLLREPLRRTDVAVAALLGAGAALIFLGGEAALSTAPRPRAGNVTAAVSGVTWALTVVGLRWLGREPGQRAGAAVVLGNGLAFLFCLPFAFPPAAGAAIDWGVVAYLGVFQIGLAYIFLVRGVSGTRAFEVALILVLEPVASTFFAWALHGEVPGTGAAMGSSVIVFGLVLQAIWAREPARAG